MPALDGIAHRINTEEQLQNQAWVALSSCHCFRASNSNAHCEAINNVMQLVRAHRTPLADILLGRLERPDGEGPDEVVE